MVPPFPKACLLQQRSENQQQRFLQEVRTLIFPSRDAENDETVTQTTRVIQSACPYKIIRYRPFGVREENQKMLGEFTTDEAYAESYAALARSCGAVRAYVV